MRADRLVATLLFLQAKGRATAAEVAEELEVSIRTARRDLEALSIAGVPVYSNAGKGGGWSLIGGARTDLTGLSAAEARALMLVTGSAPSATPELKAAVRKLVQSLPETFREEATAASGSVVVDTSRWGQQRRVDEPPFLEVLQDAVVRGRRIELGYQTPSKEPSVRIVHPLGLVAKASIWYLLAGADGVTEGESERTFRVSRVTSATVLDEAVVRPGGFNLQSTWDRLQDRFTQSGQSVVATGLVEPAMMKPLLGIHGGRVVLGPTASDGRVHVTLTGPSPFMLAVDLAPLGAGFEVIEPPEVRRELARIGTELVGLYV